MQDEAILLANELIQFIDRKNLRSAFLAEQEERGFDNTETLETIQWIEESGF